MKIPKLAILFDKYRPWTKYLSADKIFVQTAVWTNIFSLDKLLDPKSRGKRSFIKKSRNDWLFVVRGFKFKFNKSDKFQQTNNNDLL